MCGCVLRQLRQFTGVPPGGEVQTDAALITERTKKRRASRNEILDHLPHEEVVIELDARRARAAVARCTRSARTHRA